MPRVLGGGELVWVTCGTDSDTVETHGRLLGVAAIIVAGHMDKSVHTVSQTLASNDTHLAAALTHN